MMTQAEINAALLDILQLRMSPEYHAAEVMRREKGAARMASFPESSPEHAAVRLLIGTWEGIAIRVRANPELRVPFYVSNPVGHMWDALEPALEVIRAGFVGSGKRGAAIRQLYASNFRWLNRAYRTWLSDQDPEYRSAALQGINAQFG
jgi:hypothetical protein